MTGMSYEEAVSSMRSSPEHSRFIEDCYLDQDSLNAAGRFASSPEFKSVCRILSQYVNLENAAVLDLGCGNGIAAYSFAKLGARVVATDVDPSASVGLGAALKLSAAMPAARLQVVRSSAENLPFPASSFDIVYVRQALHHFRSLEQGLEQCAAVLKPQGILFACREHVVDDQAQLAEFLANHPLHKLHGGENAYQEERYKRALKQAGLRLLRTLKPYDSIINHFPIEDSELRGWLRGALTRKIGPALAAALSKFSLVESAYRARLSSGCNYPGRLFSFLAMKP